MPSLVLLAAAFLVLLTALAWVALRVFAARNDKGELTAPGCVNGCAFALLLTALGAVGLATLVVGAFVAATPPEVRETAREVRQELGGAFADLREVLRKGADEIREELERERRDTRPSGPEWSPTPEPDSETPRSAQLVDEVPVVVVVRWRGQSDPPLELLEALVGCGLVEPIDVAVASRADETDEPEQRATVNARAKGEEFDQLERCLREALEKARDVRGTSFELLEVRREDLR